VVSISSMASWAGRLNHARPSLCSSKHVHTSSVNSLTAAEAGHACCQAPQLNVRDVLLCRWTEGST
jgi:hypothetical protein